ncbi:MAG TPA: hypothetical protein VGH19_00045 [Verrucomicrobiae bacterium]
MKSPEQPEVSPYSSVLSRVREIRAAQPLPVTPKSDFIQCLRARIRQARIHLQLPDTAGLIANRRKTRSAPDSVALFLWLGLPTVVLILFAFAITRAEDAWPSVVTKVPTGGIQTFSYPVPPEQMDLSERSAIAITAQTLSKAGYDLREWEGVEFDSLSENLTIRKNRFNRVDNHSGYCIFEQALDPQPVPVTGQSNQPREGKVRRLTVTLMQKDGILKVIVSDSVRLSPRSN